MGLREDAIEGILKEMGTSRPGPMSPSEMLQGLKWRLGQLWPYLTRPSWKVCDVELVGSYRNSESGATTKKVEGRLRTFEDGRAVVEVPSKDVTFELSRVFRLTGVSFSCFGAYFGRNEHLHIFFQNERPDSVILKKTGFVYVANVIQPIYKL